MASNETVEEFLDRSRAEFSSDSELDRIDREEAEADNAFANSSDESKSQWQTEAIKDRKAVGLPILQWNRIHTYVQHVSNAGRQNKPSIKLSAGDDGTDETAQMYESRIRQILYESKADIARDTTREQQITSGRAAVRVTTEYIPGTTKQRPVVKRIENQFSVIFGPGREYDRSDADRCWVVTLISKEEHKRRFGDKSLLNQSNFAPFKGSEDWVGLGKRGEMIQIAEKFEKEYGEKDPDTDERSWKVCRYIINGAEILEQEDAITDDIGIVPQWGREAIVDGVQRHFSLINPAKDPQRLVNLYVSNIAFNIAKQPKVKWKAALGQIPANFEDAWANNSPLGIAYYLRYDEQNRDLGAPIAEASEPPIEALSAGLQQSIEAIKAAMGIYDASMGQRSNETSGVAINRRKVEGETTNYHFQDNEARTWDRVGQILLKMIDVLDADKKSVPVRHENGKTEMVPLGTPYTHPKTAREVTHTLDAKAYSLHVEQGPSYANAREQAEEAQQALITAAPELLFTEVGVNWLRNSGRPGADEDADALERYIALKTPGLIQDKNQGGPPVPPEIQQKLVALQQDNQKAHAFAQNLHEQLQTKQPEIESRERIAVKSEDVRLEMTKMQEETKRVIALATLDSKEALTKLEQELQIVHNKLDRGHELLMKVLDHGAAAQAQASDQAHASVTQASDQAHASEQSDADRQAAAEAAQQSEGASE